MHCPLPPLFTSLSYSTTHRNHLVTCILFYFSFLLVFFISLFPVFLFLLAILLLITTTSSHTFSFFYSFFFFLSFHCPVLFISHFHSLILLRSSNLHTPFFSPLLFFPLIVNLFTFYMVVPHPLLSSFTALTYFTAIVNHLITRFPIFSSL